MISFQTCKWKMILVVLQLILQPFLPFMCIFICRPSVFLKQSCRRGLQGRGYDSREGEGQRERERGREKGTEGGSGRGGGGGREREREHMTWLSKSFRVSCLATFIFQLSLLLNTLKYSLFLQLSMLAPHQKLI